MREARDPYFLVLNNEHQELEQIISRSVTAQDAQRQGRRGYISRSSWIMMISRFPKFLIKL
jgi:hypothetical protein